MLAVEIFIGELPTRDDALLVIYGGYNVSSYNGTRRNLAGEQIFINREIKL